MVNEGLKQLGLDDLQIQQTLEVVNRVPEKLDTKGIKRVIDQINIANQALIKLDESDPYFVSDANKLLSPEHSLATNPLEAIANALQMHLDNQTANVIQEVELTPQSTDSGNNTQPSRRATTPTSKNFKRYEMLTNLWNSWGHKVNLHESSDFIMFLVIALNGRFTLQKGSNLRKHYSRYYLGVDLEKNELNLGESQTMDFGVKIQYKSKNGEAPKIEELGASVELPVTIDGKKLASGVNAKRR